MNENKEWYDYLDWTRGINEFKLYGNEDDDEDDEYDEDEDSDEDEEDDEDDWLISE